VRRSLAALPSLLLLVALLMTSLLMTSLPVAGRSRIAIGAIDPDGGGPGAAAMADRLEAHEARVGRKPALWALWSRWGDRGPDDSCDAGERCAFPGDAVNELMDRGVTPVIWWLPTDPDDWEAGRYERYRRTLNGRHDAYIRAWARAAKATAKANGGKPIILRFAHESAGHWFPWGVRRFDNTPKNYKAAWRYVWRLFKSVGATRYVRFMWSQVYPYQSLYPGDRYVSYVGVTVLNFGSDRKWRAPGPMIDVRAGDAARFGKPIFVAELASHFRGGDKASWLRNAYSLAYRKHPRIKGIMYLDTDEPHRMMGHPDWRLIKPRRSDGSRPALRAYRSIAAKERFQGRIR
jgi:hypothetical protein